MPQNNSIIQKYFGSDGANNYLSFSIESVIRHSDHEHLENYALIKNIYEANRKNGSV